MSLRPADKIKWTGRSERLWQKKVGTNIEEKMQMAYKWQPTKFKGVRYREHPTRKHGVKADRYYTIRYQYEGKRQEEPLGWASAGWTEAKAFAKLTELQEAAKNHEGAKRLQEQRELKRQKEEEEKARQEAELLSRLTVSQFYRDTYLPIARTDKKARTVDVEHGLYQLWIEPHIGDKALLLVSAMDIERIKKKMIDAGRSPRTIQYALAVIRQVFNKALATGHFEGTLPTAYVRAPSINNRRIRYLSHDEADRLLGELRTHSRQLHDIAAVSLYSGARAGEVFALQWKDVDVEKGTLFLRDTKNGESRVAYLLEGGATILSERLERAKERGAYSPSALVFTGRKGDPITEVSRTFDKVVENLGFNEHVTDQRDKLVFHSLRHTYASWHAENGTSLVVIKELMGHKSLAMTERYSHLSPNAMKDAVAQLNKAKAEIISIPRRKHQVAGAGDSQVD